MKPIYSVNSKMTVKTITQWDSLLSVKTPNPLVNLIRLSEATGLPECFQLGFHTLWLGQWGGQTSACLGCRECDFNEKTLVALPSGKCVDRKLGHCLSGKPEGLLLCFHSSVFHPLKAGKEGGDYSFFRYKTSESLHLSLREQVILEREMSGIEAELHWGIDEYTYTILAERIRLLLDYVSRFYKRQFILRHDENQRIVNETDRQLEDFFSSGSARYVPLPVLSDLAAQFGCSAAYLDDLFRHETGKGTEDYINLKRISMAGRMLKQSSLSVEETAAVLGFPTTQEFCALFRKLKGEESLKRLCQ